MYTFNNFIKIFSNAPCNVKPPRIYIYINNTYSCRFYMGTLFFNCRFVFIHYNSSIFIFSLLCGILFVRFQFCPNFKAAKTKSHVWLMSKPHPKHALKATRYTINMANIYEFTKITPTQFIQIRHVLYNFVSN